MTIELPFRDTPHGRINAIGIVGGRAVWPAMGGAPEPDEDKDDDNPDDAADKDDDPDDDPDDDDPKDDDDVKAQSRKWEGRAKTNRTRAEKAEAELARIKKALNGGTDPEPDSKELKSELDTIRSRANEARIENAVLRTAPKLGADAEKLGDSRAFMAKVSKLDPEDDEFDKKMRRIIREHIKDNPSHAAEASNGKTPVTRSGGAVSGEGAKGQLTEADLEGMTPAQIMKAQAEGKLDEYMGIKKK